MLKYFVLLLATVVVLEGEQNISTCVLFLKKLKFSSKRNEESFHISLFFRIQWITHP